MSLKFHYSDDGKYMAVEPEDGRFYPFEVVFQESDFTEEEFREVPYDSYESLEALVEGGGGMVSFDKAIAARAEAVTATETQEA